jgi:hypothetical protein
MVTYRFSGFFAVLSAVSVMLAVSSAAHAQYNYYQSGGFAFNQFNYPPIGDSTKYRNPKKSANAASERTSTSSATANSSSSASSPARSSSSRASANNNPLPYKRDNALSAKIRDEFLQDFTRQMAAAEAAEMRATVEQADFVQVAAGFAQLQGLDSATMSGLIAFWYGQSWAVANQKPLPTSQQYRGIETQLRATMASMPDWDAMADAKRQNFFERLAYPLIVQKANYQAYLRQGKTDSLNKMANATQQGLQKIGVDLRTLRLSDSGFVKL